MIFYNKGKGSPLGYLGVNSRTILGRKSAPQNERSYLFEPASFNLLNSPMCENQFHGKGSLVGELKPEDE